MRAFPRKKAKIEWEDVMRKSVAYVLVGIMGMSMLLTGCSGQKEAEKSVEHEKTEAETTPYGKYEETVV